jgi:4-carboxymuconolactone decarboxylase
MAAMDRREIGRQTYESVMQTEPPERPSVFQCNGRLDQEFAELWTRGVLSRRDRRWLTLATLAGQGAESMLRAHVYGALRSEDINLDELLEAVYHFALYRGFGRAQAFEETIWQVADELGLEPTDACDLSTREWPDQPARVNAGRFEFSAVMVFPPPLPESDVFSGRGIQATVFAEMWTRGVLSPRDRRLITLACVATSAVPSPVTTHVQAAMETGDLTFEEMQEVTFHLSFYTGWPQGSHMNVAMQEGNIVLMAKREGNAALVAKRGPQALS